MIATNNEISEKFKTNNLVVNALILKKIKKDNFV